MPRPGDRGPTDTGVLLQEKLPVPKMGRESEPKMRRRSGGAAGRKLMLFGFTLLAGAMIGFLLRPVIKADPRVGKLEAELANSQKLAESEKTRADAKAKELDTTVAAKQAVDQKLAEAQKAQTALASQAADAAARTKDVEAEQTKLKKVVDKSAGAIAVDGDDIRISLVDQVMFKPNDDQLTPRGKQILDRLAIALKELPDKQIWVQGHTDDQPVALLTTPKAPPPPRPAPPPKKGAKPAPAPPPAAAPGPKFATNWELSAGRALAVVHYLQDSAKVDPTRLAALAFGQYHPISKNRALNRRIEIVLHPKAKK